MDNWIALLETVFPPFFGTKSSNKNCRICQFHSLNTFILSSSHFAVSFHCNLFYGIFMGALVRGNHNTKWFTPFFGLFFFLLLSFHFGDQHMEPFKLSLQPLKALFMCILSCDIVWDKCQTILFLFWLPFKKKNVTNKWKKMLKQKEKVLHDTHRWIGNSI